MRVVHISAYFAPAFNYGGPVRSILDLCQGLQRAGIDVEVFTTNANGSTDLPREFLGQRLYEGVPVRYFPRSFPRRFFGAGGLRAAVKGAVQQFDLFHIHGLWNLPAWCACCGARKRRLPYILSPRGMLDRGSVSHHPVRKRVAYAMIERTNLNGAALLHATSEAEAAGLRARRLLAPVIVLPNGVELSSAQLPARGNFHRRLRLPESAPLVVFLGRVHPIKRLDLLIAAFGQILRRQPDAHLVIAGPEEAGYRGQLEGQFARLLKKLSWTGELGQAEKWSLLAEARTLVMCSDSESFGLSVAEAMAAGIPVVVTRTCPWSEVLTTNCGFWVEQDVAAIANALGWVLAHPAEARAMGQRGRALVASRYSWAPIAQAMAEQYAGVLRRCSREAAVQ